MEVDAALLYSALAHSALWAYGMQLVNFTLSHFEVRALAPASRSPSPMSKTLHLLISGPLPHGQLADNFTGIVEFLPGLLYSFAHSSGSREQTIVSACHGEARPSGLAPSITESARGFSDPASPFGPAGLLSLTQSHCPTRTPLHQVSLMAILWSLRLGLFLLLRLPVRGLRDTRITPKNRLFFWPIHGTWGVLCSLPVFVLNAATPAAASDASVHMDART